MTKTLLENINAVPALPESIQEVERIHQDEDSTFEDMQRAELKVVHETVMPNGEITDESIATAKDTIGEFELDLESFENALEKVLNS